jgi:hypothetical protein
LPLCFERLRIPTRSRLVTPNVHGAIPFRRTLLRAEEFVVTQVRVLPESQQHYLLYVLDRHIPTNPHSLRILNVLIGCFRSKFCFVSCCAQCLDQMPRIPVHADFDADRRFCDAHSSEDGESQGDKDCPH